MIKQYSQRLIVILVLLFITTSFLYGEAKDTAKVVIPDMPDSTVSSLVTDSTKILDSLIASLSDDSLASGDSIQFDTIPDTTYRSWQEPHWRVGASWELGSMDLFDQWEKSLSDTLFLKLPVIGSDSSVTLPLPYTPNEPPSQYNISFPFMISYITAIRPYGQVQLFSRYMYMSKEADALIQNSETKEVLTKKRYRLRFNTAALGVGYEFHIDSTYFGIKRIEDIRFSAGLSVSPFTLISLKHEEIPQVNATLNQRHWGVGFAWHLAFMGSRKLESSSKFYLRSGLSYTGTSYPLFYRDGNRSQWGDISRLSDRSSEPISFLTHRFALVMELINTKKPPVKIVPKKQKKVLGRESKDKRDKDKKKDKKRRIKKPNKK